MLRRIHKRKKWKNLIYSTAINIKTKFNYLLHRLLPSLFLNVQLNFLKFQNKANFLRNLIKTNYSSYSYISWKTEHKTHLLNNKLLNKLQSLWINNEKLLSSSCCLEIHSDLMDQLYCNKKTNLLNYETIIEIQFHKNVEVLTMER